MDATPVKWARFKVVVSLLSSSDPWQACLHTKGCALVYATRRAQINMSAFRLIFFFTLEHHREPNATKLPCLKRNVGKYSNQTEF